MSKIDLNTSISDFGWSQINANFQEIEDEFNQKVLYRDNPVGEPNSMNNDLDMNGQRIFNLPAPSSPSEPLRLQDIIGDVPIEVPTSADLVSSVPVGYITATNVQDALGNINAKDTVQDARLSDIETLNTTQNTRLTAVEASDASLQSQINTDVANLSAYQTLIGGTNGSSNVGYKQGATGTVTRSVNARLSEAVSIRDFGAVADNSTDIRPALDAAAAAGVTTLYIPNGVYRIKTPFLTNNSNFHIIGAGPGSTIINADFTSGDILCFGDGSANPGQVSVRDLQLNSVVTRVGGAAIRFRNGHNMRVEKLVTFGDHYHNIQLDGGPQQFLYFVEDVELNAGRTGIIVGEDGTLVQDFWINRGVTNAMSDSGLLLRHCSGGYISQMDFLGGFRGISMFPDVGKTVIGCTFMNCLGDTNSGTGWYISTNGGRTASIRLVDCWGSSCGLDGVTIDQGSGAVDGIQFTSPHCINNGKSGIFLGPSVNVSINNPQIFQNSTSASGTHDGINVAANVSHFQIIGGAIRVGGVLGAASVHRYGVHVNTGTSNFYIIRDYNGSGNSLGPILDNGTGVNKVISVPAW